MENYDKLAQKIARSSGLDIDEITRRVEAKRAKLSGLISKEGAAQIVAAELGINFDKEKLKINELIDGMKRVNVVGEIIEIYPVREFKTDTREGKVANLVLADDTGNVKVVLWDTNHIELIETGKIKKGDVVEINQASLRNNEIHLSGFSDIKLSNEVLEEVITEKSFAEENIENFRQGLSVRSRAFIVQVFEPKFFEVCPECGKKIIISGEGSTCETHGKVVPVKRALLNLVLDDGTGNIRAVLFSEAIEKLGFNLKNDFLKEREKFLGKEMFFGGQIRKNKMFENLEMIVEDVKDVEIEELIQVFES